MHWKIALAISPLLAYAAEYGLSDYHFIDPDRPWHVETRYRAVAPAKFRTHRWGKVMYSDATAGVYFTQFFNDENSLTYELGYDYLRFHWPKNPRFTGENYNYLNGSLGYVSTTLDRWKWIINSGFSIDTDHFDFAKTSVGHAMLWGRYSFADCCGVHVGILGWYGVLSGRAWPIFGFDWKFNDQWSAKSVYPWDFSLNYAFNDNWSIDASYAWFGYPYRYPHRAHHGINGFHDPIFMVYSNGAELDLKYKFEHILRASVGIGWDFGGWILIKNRHSHNKYFHYDNAPFVQGSFEITF